MKARLLFLSACFFLQVCSCEAVENIKVVSMEDFSTASPKEFIDVKVLNDSALGSYDLEHNTILHCGIVETVAPKRGKRNATFYIKPVNYETNGITYPIEEEMLGKYSTMVLSKDEIKELPYGQIAKKGALLVGDYYVKGLSMGVAFVQGFAKNEKDNRFKSGIVNAYEESPVSYIEKGEELEIKKGDDFYFVFKTPEDLDEPNYSYTPAENSADKN